MYSSKDQHKLLAPLTTAVCLHYLIMKPNSQWTEAIWDVDEGVHF